MQADALPEDMPVSSAADGITEGVPPLLTPPPEHTPAPTPGISSTGGQLGVPNKGPVLPFVLPMLSLPSGLSRSAPMGQPSFLARTRSEPVEDLTVRHGSPMAATSGSSGPGFQLPALQLSSRRSVLQQPGPCLKKLERTRSEPAEDLSSPHAQVAPPLSPRQKRSQAPPPGSPVKGPARTMSLESEPPDVSPASAPPPSPRSNRPRCRRCEDVIQDYEPTCTRCLERQYKVATLGHGTQHAAALRQKDAELSALKEALAAKETHIHSKDARLEQMEQLLDHWRDVELASKDQDVAQVSQQLEASVQEADKLRRRVQKLEKQIGRAGGGQASHRGDAVAADASHIRHGRPATAAAAGNRGASSHAVVLRRRCTAWAQATGLHNVAAGLSLSVVAVSELSRAPLPNTCKKTRCICMADLTGRGASKRSRQGTAVGAARAGWLTTIVPPLPSPAPLRQTCALSAAGDDYASRGHMPRLHDSAVTVMMAYRVACAVGSPGGVYARYLAARLARAPAVPSMAIGCSSPGRLPRESDCLT
jgi:hypothetical protein